MFYFLLSCILTICAQDRYLRIWIWISAQNIPLERCPFLIWYSLVNLTPRTACMWKPHEKRAGKICWIINNYAMHCPILLLKLCRLVGYNIGPQRRQFPLSNFVFWAYLGRGSTCLHKIRFTAEKRNAEVEEWSKSISDQIQDDGQRPNWKWLSHSIT